MNHNTKYIKSILATLGLGGFQSGMDKVLLEKAASWACRGSWQLAPYQPVALRPCLETVKDGKSMHYFQPQVLGLSRTHFPQAEAPSPQALNNQVAELNDKLSGIADGQLLTALEYYASNLAAGPAQPDLPLYDFIKITAAIAHCLDTGNGKMRLAGGSISGIQTYLYDIISKRANKLLKGRSFYLHLLADSMANALLDQFDLSPSHVVYASGGGFFILLPDSEKAEIDFDNFKKDLTQKIYGQHSINLFADLALSAAFDATTNAEEVWDELYKKLNLCKLRRLSDNETLKVDLPDFIEYGGDTERDRITNEEILDPSVTHLLDDDDPESIVHTFTNQQIELGKQLRNAEYWITARSSFDKAFPDRLGYWHLLDDKIPKISLPNDAVIRQINVANPHQPFVFYGGNTFPAFDKDEIIDGVKYEKGDPKTFDVLAGEENTFRRLGILRMDVDGLGAVFSQHIGNKHSFVRYAAVSRHLDWFFKGWLNEICKQYKNTVLIVYSGGDDLFIVGKWNDVLDVSLQIQSDFDKWACSNLTISGGLVVLTDKFPIMQGSKLAGRAEDKAKTYTDSAGVNEKNALCLFDSALGWKREIPVVIALKEKLLDLLINHKAPRSLLGKIDIHAASLAEQEKQKLTPRWTWNLVYDLSQLANNFEKRNQQTADEIRILRDAAFADDDYRKKRTRYHYLTLLQIAARWAELELRSANTIVELETSNA
ncbi:MAG: type III-A CRISPR-associated protein Cas10/Csm1 [Saprospiraceae bacterium]|nr:type III-A CRISPR-associated protein Cas10/Csm1 [Saprospiraceae bacterium]